MKRLLAVVAMSAAIPLYGHAQTNVTLFGIVDAGIKLTDYDRGAARSLSGVQSGHRNANRWGLRGAEDLGGGLSAIFRLEQGFDLGTGILGQGGRTFGRHSYVGLDGGMGTLALGRVSNFDGGSFDMLVQIDPFEAGFGIASLASTMSGAGGLRVDNAVLYRTPMLGGFQAGWIHSFNTNGAQNAGGNSANTRYDNIGASFRAGQFYGAATYSVARFPDANNFEDQKMLHVGATYDLKTVKLHGAIGRETDVRSSLVSAVGKTAEGTDATMWMVGASAPIGEKGQLLASYQKRDGKSQTIGANRFNADLAVLGVGYVHSLSRRTSLYASIAKSNGLHTLQEGTADTDFANRRELAVGLNHRF